MRERYGFSDTWIAPRRRDEMGKGLILWLLGVPGIVVILLLVTHVI